MLRINESRRELLIGSASGAFAVMMLPGVSLLASCASTRVPPSLADALRAAKAGIDRVEIVSAGKGSAFLPYAEALAASIVSAGIASSALETGGSIDNVRRLDSLAPNPRTALLGTVFLGTAQEALSGAAWTQGKRFEHLRALAPMYETSFQCVALRKSNLVSISALDGKRVGVGPANGPAENYFKGVIDIAKIAPTLVNGTPAALVEDLVAGRIDALWQGASVPIPSLKQVADAHDAVVFGLSETQVNSMLQRFPALAMTTVAANTYRGQTSALQSVAAWNFLMIHKDANEAFAYWLTRAMFDPVAPLATHASARTTRIEDATKNRVVPFHVGALRAYRERGVSLG